MRKGRTSILRSTFNRKVIPDLRMCKVHIPQQSLPENIEHKRYQRFGHVESTHESIHCSSIPSSQNGKPTCNTTKSWVVGLAFGMPSCWHHQWWSPAQSIHRAYWPDILLWLHVTYLDLHCWHNKHKFLLQPSLQVSSSPSSVALVKISIPCRMQQTLSLIWPFPTWSQRLHNRLSFLVLNNFAMDHLPFDLQSSFLPKSS